MNRVNVSHFVLILEQLLVQKRKLAVIPVFSPEWSVTFTVRFLDLSGLPLHCNIIHLTENENSGSYGNRTPMVYLRSTNSESLMIINSAINSRTIFWRLDAPVAVDGKTKHVEIHQRYVSGGKYRYFIKINGKETYSIINEDARQFYNVKVYASDPWYDACPGYIKNLEITNFL